MGMYYYRPSILCYRGKTAVEVCYAEQREISGLKATYNRQMAPMKAAAPNLIENLLLRWLTQDASKRGTAHDALRHKRFSHVHLRAWPEGNKHARSPLTSSSSLLPTSGFSAIDTRIPTCLRAMLANCLEVEVIVNWVVDLTKTLLLRLCYATCAIHC